MSNSCDKNESITEGVRAPLVNVQTKLKSENSKNVRSNLNIGKKNSKIDEKKNHKLTAWSLINFLKDFKVKKGEEYTHTTMGDYGASYNIPINKKEDLIHLLHEAIFVKNIPFHLTEKPPQHTQIKVDLDFKYPLEQANRIYTVDHIKEIITLYNQAITYYLDVNPDRLNCFVFERDEPYQMFGITKDGIHLMYPDIICDTKIQHLIREHVIMNCQHVLSQLGCKNDYNDIIDKAIVSKNNWLMYGCSKPKIKPYKLTKIYDNEFEECEYELSIKDLISELSIRDHEESVSEPIKNDLKHLIEKKITHVNEKKPKITLRSKTSSITPEIEKVIKLVEMLSDERADGQQTWIRVGFCLHNIDLNNTNLLNSWIEFSEKSQKFKEGECEQRWDGMTVKESGGLNIGSLHTWAKEDNPVEYKKIKDNEIWSLILKSQTQTNYDVARVVHHMYEDKYKCVSIKHNAWYEFRNHKWELTECGVSLDNKISREVVDQYLKCAQYYNNIAYSASEEEKDACLQKNKNLADVTYKLRSTKFKANIMTELQKLFYDDKFVKKINQNPDLLGFDNGVYDLKADLFRDGLPEDYITISVGYDYLEFKEDDELVVAIFKFFYQIFPDQVLRDYVLILLSSFLEGRNHEEKFYFWTGTGGNGKSKLLEHGGHPR